jgi:hypothetical protein
VTAVRAWLNPERPVYQNGKTYTRVTQPGDW